MARPRFSTTTEFPIDTYSGASPFGNTNGSGVRQAPGPNNAMADALAGIIRPTIGGSQFQAPPIRQNYRPTPIAPNPGLPTPAQQVVPFQGISGGGRDLGGGAKAAGLEKLGQGIEKAMKAIGDKRKANAAAGAGRPDRPSSFLTPPAAPTTGRSAAPGTNAPASTPYTPSPVGASSGTPSFAQPDTFGQPGAAAQPIPPIGGGGGSLPYFAAGVPGAAQGAPGGTAAGSQAQYDPRLINYIYGEAGDQGARGQQAVANVLANRAASNFRGYGTTMESQATAGTGVFGGNSEINGYRVPPANVDTSTLHSALQNAGSDITGGATFFANPGASHAAWARNLTSDNSLKIGDHYFTNNTNGVPFQPGPQMAPPASAQTGAAAYAAMPPSIGGPIAAPVQAAGPAAGSQPVIPGQTDPHAPGFDPNSVPFQRTPEMAPPPGPTAPPGPTQISPGQPQTGPAYSDETWNNRPQFDYGAPATGASGVPVPQAPQAPLINNGQPGVYSMPDTGPQGMNDQGMNPLAAALAQGDPNNPGISPNIVSALNGGDPFGFGSAPTPDIAAPVTADFAMPSFDFGGFNFG